MSAASAARRQKQPTSVTTREESVETMLRDFQCEACGQNKIRRTARESWYTCVVCGYSFGIEPYPKLMRAREVGAGGVISH